MPSASGLVVTNRNLTRPRARKGRHAATDARTSRELFAPRALQGLTGVIGEGLHPHQVESAPRRDMPLEPLQDLVLRFESSGPAPEAVWTIPSRGSGERDGEPRSKPSSPNLSPAAAAAAVRSVFDAPH